MPRKPAATMPNVCPRNAPGFSRNAITTAGSRPSATMPQRKNAIENGGTLPATPRARIMLETWAVATSKKPNRPSISRALPAASFGSIMFNPMLAPLPPARSYPAGLPAAIARSLLCIPVTIPRRPQRIDASRIAEAVVARGQQDLTGRGTPLDPVNQCGEELVLLARRRLVGIAGQFRQRHAVVLAADGVGPPLRAMRRTRQQIHPHELLRLGVPAHRRHHALVIIAVAGGRDRIVDEAGIDEDLAAEFAQLAGVRLVGDEVAEQRRLQRDALVHGVGEAGVIQLKPFVAHIGRGVRDRIA